MTGRDEGKRRPDQIREVTREYSAPADGRAVDSAVLDALIARVVQAVDPDRIILFGSAARGEAGPDSDVDLLVIKSGIESRGAVEDQIHRNLFGLDVSVDVVVATPSDVEYLRDRVGSVIGPAVKEGREIYVRSSA